jgi:two-component sensor histidine kinase
MSSEVIDAFRGIQDRVISMVLINEELYKCEKSEVLDFFHNTFKSSLIFFRIIGL